MSGAKKSNAKTNKVVRVTVASYDKDVQLQMRIAFPLSDMILVIDSLKLNLSQGNLDDLTRDRAKDLITNLVSISGG